MLSRNINAYKVYNYDNIGFTSLGSGTSLNEVSLSTTLDGDPYSALMVVLHVTSTGDYVGYKGTAVTLATGQRQPQLCATLAVSTC